MFRLIVLVFTVVTITSSASIEKGVNDVDGLDGRIVGGTVTDISSHPHQVSMRYKSCSTCAFKHRCGGSIIKPNIVVTAAHCVVGGVKAENVHIVAGANQRNGHGSVIPVEKIIYHEEYQKNVAYENDIAILVLAIDLQLDSYNIKAIEMVEKPPVAGEIATITGWGTTTEGGTPADFLLEVGVPVISNESCEAKYGSGRINESMMCAGTAKGGKDACQGDSGGPLLVKGRLAGVVSWGNGCARPEYPGVYANVSYLRPWIDSVIKSNS